MILARIPRGWRIWRGGCARWPTSLRPPRGRMAVKTQEGPGWCSRPFKSNPPGSLGLNQTGAGVTSRSAISCEARADARKARVLRLAFQVASRGNFTFGDGGVAYGCGHSSSRLGSRLFKKAHK